jgi:hypothetical protein
MRTPLLLAAGLLAACAESAAPSRPMPAFTLEKLGGGSFASTELAGKPALINFWHPK